MACQEVPVPQGPSRRVLILDFDAATLIALEQLLEEADFETTTTWNVREACLWLEQKSFDAIVIGDHLPQIDPRAILRRLDGLQKLLPCVVMRVRPDFSVDPKWTRMVTTLPGCNSSEVLEKVQQRLGLSTSKLRNSAECTPAQEMDEPPEPILVKMLWGERHAQ